MLLSVLSLVLALLGAAWAGLLALAEESPRVARTLSDQGNGDEAPPSPYRAIHVSRIA